MKIIFVKYKKSYRNGVVSHIDVFREDDATDDIIELRMEKWASKEPAGQNYGYDVSWTIHVPSLEEFEKVKAREERKLLNIKSKLVDQIQKLSFLKQE